MAAFNQHQSSWVSSMADHRGHQAFENNYGALLSSGPVQRYGGYTFTRRPSTEYSIEARSHTPANIVAMVRNARSVIVILFCLSHCLSLVGLQPSSSIFHRLCGTIEPFSATLAQDGLAECDQPGKNPLKYAATAGHWTRATGRTDSETHSFSHWAIMTRAKGRTDSEIHSFSHWAIMTRAMERTESEIHWFTPLSYHDQLVILTECCLTCYSIHISYHDCMGHTGQFSWPLGRIIN